MPKPVRLLVSVVVACGAVVVAACALALIGAPLPEPGLLVIMPSYYMHHTNPARAGSLRVSVPFDVVDRRSFVTLAEMNEA